LTNQKALSAPGSHVWFPIRRSDRNYFSSCTSSYGLHHSIKWWVSHDDTYVCWFDGTI